MLTSASVFFTTRGVSNDRKEIFHGTLYPQPKKNPVGNDSLFVLFTGVDVIQIELNGSNACSELNILDKKSTVT